MTESHGNHQRPRVAVIMGSKSDWPTMHNASRLLGEFQINHECRVVSAHRTPNWMIQYAQSAASRGIQMIIAGAGGAAHLPGMVASLTPLPVVGVPIQSKNLNGMDSLLSIVQMPAGVPVATMSIGTSGARNAALFVARTLATTDDAIRERLMSYIQQQTDSVMKEVEL